MLFVMSPKSKLELPPLPGGTAGIGKRIARIRKEKGLTQVQLAERIGIIQVLVSDYERGRLRLHADMLIRFAAALQVSTDELLGLKGNGHDADDASLNVLRRLKRIQGLPPARQKALLHTIDTFLKGAEA